ncbi:MAG: metalloregulator ArsR/SmtB family transcription factor [Polyangiaceae bacterium]
MSPEERAKVFKALADPRRVEIVELLAQGSQCGTVLAESLGISVALLCHHWEVLVDAGILKKERLGQLRVCTLDSGRLREALSMGAAWQEPQVPTVAKATRSKIAGTLGKRSTATATGKRAPRPTAKKSKSATQL